MGGDRRAPAVGLRHFTLTLPSPAALDAALAHLRANGHEAQATGDGFLVRDPSGNAILLCHTA